MAEKILFVDDEPDVCRMMSDCLRLYGYEVVTADKPKLALEFAAKGKFDLGILDVNMTDLTGQDGSNLLAAFKRKFPNMPIILYTGMSAEDEEVKDMIKQGVFQHVSKSATLEELIQAVQKALKSIR